MGREKRVTVFLDGIEWGLLERNRPRDVSMGMYLRRLALDQLSWRESRGLRSRGLSSRGASDEVLGVSGSGSEVGDYEYIPDPQ